jgi:tetratricopeptide (TPR) repeat protein
MGLIGLLTIWCGIRSQWASQQQWDRILKWDKNDAEAWHELATHMKTKQDMLICHRKAVELSPFEPYYIEALARTLESFPRKTYIPDAMQTYINALQLAPTRAIDDLAVARLLWRIGEAGDALEWTKKALALEPNYREADFWKARCLVSLGRPQEATSVLKTLVRLHQEDSLTPRTAPPSPYEEAILHFEEDAVRNSQAHLLSPSTNGVQ